MKTKKIRIKQGFTIVELVIVIGVIGVLSAVLIPTFINLNNKANQAADESLIKNLNTQLAIKRETEGKNVTMTGALADALEAGYKVENLTPKSGKDIVWNQEKDEFFQLDSVPADGYKYWTIAKSNADLSKGYSSYLYFKPTGDIKVGTGFDVGEYSGVNVTYERAAGEERSVIVRTNGGTFTVNAPSDVVSHYSDVDKVTVEHVKGSSYHEYGRVRVGMEVQDGHVVVEDAGVVQELSVPAVASGNSVSVSVNNGGTVNNAVVDDANATVEVASAGKVGQYVGDTSKISGAGAEATKANVVTRTEVGTTDDLLTAVANENVKFIVFTDDINIDEAIEISRNLIIDGANHKLTVKSGDSQRVVNVYGEDVEVTLKNLKMVGPVTGTYTRGLNIGKGNPKVVVDHCEISASYYAVNLIGSALRVNLTVADSYLKGWCALQSWGALNKITVSNSTLEGINDKNVGSSNGFGTVVVEGDTTFATTEGAEKINITINGGKIIANATNDNPQMAVQFNSNSIGNTVSVNGTEIELIGEKAGKVGVSSEETAELNSFLLDGKEML